VAGLRSDARRPPGGGSSPVASRARSSVSHPSLGGGGI
jgi:hypothetical protein